MANVVGIQICHFHHVPLFTLPLRIGSWWVDSAPGRGHIGHCNGKGDTTLNKPGTALIPVCLLNSFLMRTYREYRERERRIISNDKVIVVIMMIVILVVMRIQNNCTVICFNWSYKYGKNPSRKEKNLELLAWPRAWLEDTCSPEFCRPVYSVLRARNSSHTLGMEFLVTWSICSSMSYMSSTWDEQNFIDLTSSRSAACIHIFTRFYMSH